MEVHIHTRIHPADMVGYCIVEEVHKGFVEVVRRKDSEGEGYRKDSVMERRKGSVVRHNLNMVLRYWRVVAVLRKESVVRSVLDPVLLR